MNFFEHQELARKKTLILVGLLIAAVVCLIVVTIILVAAFSYFFAAQTTSIDAAQAYSTPLYEHFKILLKSELILWVSVAVIGVVCVGWLYKTQELQKGGRYIAESLGGQLLVHDNAKGNEKTVLNIVEEMAIASGTPVPLVYLLDDESVNAFAAGTNLNCAVIGVTRGCVTLLNRDQLQGVIAHEFSHIHHGDMKLNMRLVSILHGILLIGLIGRFITQSTTRRSYSSSRSKKDSGAQLALFGIALMAVGFGGTLFGNIIKAAVSREREFLADASAVQFTRNPYGIAGALHKIGRSAAGSKISASNAAEYSHFYFANGVKSFFGSVFATHPKLSIRITRILPDAIDRLKLDKIDRESRTDLQDAENGQPDQNKEALKKNAGIDPAGLTSLGAVLATVGTMSPAGLSESAKLLQSLPQSLHSACHTPFQARGVIYAMLLDREPSIREKQITLLKKQAHPATYREFKNIYIAVEELPRKKRWPLLQLCVPALREMSETQTQLFLDNVKALIQADNKVNLFEWCCQRTLLSALTETPEKAVFSLENVQEDVLNLLRFTAQLSGIEMRAQAFDAGVKTIWPALEIDFQLINRLDTLDSAMTKLSQLKALQKPQLLKALIRTVEYDERKTLSELELLKAVASCLNCPIPITG